MPSKVHCQSCPAFLKSSFAGCSMKALGHIENRTSAKFQAGEILVSCGQVSSGIFCIAKGLAYDCIEVGNDIQVSDRIYSPGDVISTAFFSKSAVSISDVRALGEVEVCVINTDSMMRLTTEDSSFSHSLIQYLAMQDQLGKPRNGFFRAASAVDRVRSLLSLVSHEYGLKFSINRKQVSLLSGLTLETVSRTLTLLEKTRVIKRSGWQIEVLEPSASVGC